ncbi:hypothetical protein KQX54_021368 [Cotesia glomerata]|uniref:Uncharacterized protein n=1 Tax=Cotesia glomerata TaxID=32391 RepID=A0AAV7J756_COTGL|nr:hypothetical protein KQX54_021368 [Cotesia glomerata]
MAQKTRRISYPPTFRVRSSGFGLSWAICAKSIWTYDGNNLAALGDVALCVPLSTVRRCMGREMGFPRSSVTCHLTSLRHTRVREEKRPSYHNQMIKWKTKRLRERANKDHDIYLHLDVGAIDVRKMENPKPSCEL